MPELTREEKLKLLEKLSPRLQELMTSEDTGATLLYLGQKYHLSDHQVRLLSKILGDVILGILPVTNLPLEISTKAAVDTQTASGLAQDLNDLILSPKPTMTTPTPAPAPVMKAVPYVSPMSADRYREPPVVSRVETTTEAPGIIDLRRTPPAVSKVEPPPPVPISVVPAPIPPAPRPAPPLTFTKPIERPLIEAEPHKISSVLPKVDTYREPEEQPPASINNLPTMDVKPKEPPPQYIMRPSGLPPTDFPRDVLDLRKDKGEF